LSEINKDKEVLNKGRQQPLKGADAPLRERINQKLFKKVDELEIGQKVATLWSLGNANRTEWLNRQSAYLELIDQHLPKEDEDGASSLHIPMPLTVCKTMHARFMQALWVDPPCHTKARAEASIDRVSTVQDTMRYALMEWANYGKGAEETVDRWVWDWITVGSGLMKLRWDCKYTRFVDVKKLPKKVAPKYKETPVGGVLEAQYVEEEQEVTVVKKVYDGPVFDLVDAEDIVIIGGQGDPDLADATIHRERMTASELWTLADRKIFDNKAVTRVIEGGNDKIDGAEGSQIKIQRAQNAGQAQVDSEAKLDRYEIAEAYLKVDVDGSGINSDVIVWVHLRSKTLLRATYLYRAMPTGEIPIFKADYLVRKGQEWGTGLLELLYPLSKELDAMHNMRIDFGLVSVMPFGFYRPTSGLDPEKIELEPGALIPVDNPQTDVFFPNLGNRTVFGMQEEQAVQNMVERLTSISDINLGVLGGSQGATRTATGSRMLNNEMSANLDVFLRRLNRGWRKALRCLFHMTRQRMPAGLSFRVTGETGEDVWRTLKDGSALDGDYDFEVSPNSSSSNEAIQQQQAQDIMALASNPLAIQMGIISPGNFYEAMRNQFRSIKVKDFGRYITKPQGYSRSLTPEEEANRVLRGMDVQLTPEMDHEGFIAFWEHMKKDDQLLGQFNQDQAMALESHARKHAQMAQALQQVAAQSANAGQMQRNAAMSSQQAPVAQQAAPPAPLGPIQ
jgi:hypothetical protein